MSVFYNRNVYVAVEKLFVDIILLFSREGLILTTNADISSGNKFLVQIIVCGMLENLPNVLSQLAFLSKTISNHIYSYIINFFLSDHALSYRYLKCWDKGTVLLAVRHIWARGNIREFV